MEPRYALAAPGLDLYAGPGGEFSSKSSEYQVKAAYLYNFAKLVDWPAPANGPVVIAVFGRDPFGDVLAHRGIARLHE